MDSLVVVREMNKEDIPAVSLIEKESFSIPWSENAFLESLDLPYSHFFVATIEAKIVGYIGMYIAGDEGDIINVAVSVDYRRKGIGDRLIKATLSKAVLLELYTVNLEVRESNESAIALYAKNGFQNIGIRKNFYEKPTENAVIMKKQIGR